MTREPLTELQALVTGAILGSLMKATEHGFAIVPEPITDEQGFTEKIRVKGVRTGDEVLVVVMREAELPPQLRSVE